MQQALHLGWQRKSSTASTEISPDHKDNNDADLGNSNKVKEGPIMDHFPVETRTARASVLWLALPFPPILGLAWDPLWGSLSDQEWLCLVLSFWYYSARRWLQIILHKTINQPYTFGCSLNIYHAFVCDKDFGVSTFFDLVEHVPFFFLLVTQCILERWQILVFHVAPIPAPFVISISTAFLHVFCTVFENTVVLDRITTVTSLPGLFWLFLIYASHICHGARASVWTDGQIMQLL